MYIPSVRYQFKQGRILCITGEFDDSVFRRGSWFSEDRKSIDRDVIFFVMFDFGEEYISCIVYLVDIQEDKLIKAFSQLPPYRCE